MAQIVAGEGHTCARKTDDTEVCWGANGDGQVGDNSTTQRNTFVPVSGLTGATTISAGTDQSCAVIGSGTLKCWGENNQGEVGDNTVSQRLVPTQVLGLTCP